MVLSKYFNTFYNKGPLKTNVTNVGQKIRKLKFLHF